MNEITTVNAQEIAVKYLDTLGIAKKLSPDQKNTFIEICSAYQLNPFKREIWAVPYKDDICIIVGYETYLKRADRTGKLDGWDVSFTGSVQTKEITDQYGKKKTVIDAENSDLCAKLTIYRKDWTHPFTHEAYIAEFSGVSPIWIKSPRFMLKKVVVSQGFRLCFPDEMGGLPYTEEEVSTYRDIPQYKEITQPEISQGDMMQLLSKKCAIGSDDWIHFNDMIMNSGASDYPAIMEKLSKFPDIPTDTTDYKAIDKLKEDIASVLTFLIENKIGDYHVTPKRNASIKKHLHTETVRDCKDANLLSTYLDYLTAQKPKSLDELKAEAMKMLDGLLAEDQEQYKAVINDCSTIEEITKTMSGITATKEMK